MSNCVKRKGDYLKEKDLVKRAQAGDLDAFKALVKENEARVAATVIGMVGRCPEAEDIGQETFIRFYNKLSGFRAESSVSTYLTRIAINLSLNELKRRKRKNRLFSASRDDMPNIKDENGETQSMELNETLQMALQKLKPKFKKVVVLRLIQGYSTRETAQILSLPEGTVLSRLARAQEKIKNELKSLGS